MSKKKKLSITEKLKLFYNNNNNHMTIDEMAHKFVILNSNK